MMDTIFVDIPNHGEDAPPFADDGILIVCDGLGSGRQMFTVEGETASNSHFASRETSRLTSEFFRANRDRILDSRDDATIAAELRETLIRGLKTYSDKYKISVEDLGIKGSTVRTLPTTLASVVYGIRDGKLVAVTFWAGDSRCYCLSPSKGLMQLTVDDGMTPQDAMESLVEDSPMSNLVNLSGEFHINYARYVLDTPCLLMAASDGMFAYQSSPMHFEYMFLPRGENFNPQENIIKETNACHYDDCTLACVSVGIDTLEEYNTLFAPRGEIVRPMTEAITKKNEELEMCRDAYRQAKKLPTNVPANIEEMNRTKELVSQETRNFDSLRKELWDTYKTNYYPEDTAVHKDVPCKPMKDIFAEFVKTAEAEPEKIPEETVSEEKPTTGIPAAPETPAATDSVKEKTEAVPAPPVEAKTKPAPTPVMTPSSEESKEKPVAEPSESARRLDFVIPDIVERMANTIDEIGKFNVTNHFEKRYGFLYATGNDKKKKYELYLKPASKEDEQRKKILSSGNFKTMCLASEGRMRIPVDCGLLGGFFWMAYVKQPSTRISIDMTPSIIPKDRAQIIQSVAEIIEKLHSSGYLCGSVSPDSFIFVREGDYSCHAIIRNSCTLSKLNGKVKIDDGIDVDGNYDLRCLGMLICEIYAGRPLVSVDRASIRKYAESFRSKQDQALLELAENILFRGETDLQAVLKELQRIEKLLNYL